MHHHCEIVMPPTDDVVAAVEQVMKPFDEQPEGGGGDDEMSRYAFWDWYVIGGRWAGKKILARPDEGRLKEFEEWLQSEKVTVSALSAGKQELSPASQIPKVDAKWNEMFPSDTFIPCPLFKHSNNQYGEALGATMQGDVSTLADTEQTMKCERVIFCAPADGDRPVRAEFMLTDSAWNGCNHMPVAWDGALGSALQQWREKMEHYTEEFKAKVTPQCDWLVVTVDYHS